MKKKLGILLTTSSESEDVRTVIKLSEAALRKNMDVEIFLMADGVYNLKFENFIKLSSKGVRIVVCAHNAIERGINKIDEVVWGSQWDLAQIAHTADRFLSFN